jgi:hypothetical protein
MSGSDGDECEGGCLVVCCTVQSDNGDDPQRRRLVSTRVWCHIPEDSRLLVASFTVRRYSHAQSPARRPPLLGRLHLQPEDKVNEEKVFKIDDFFYIVRIKYKTNFISVASSPTRSVPGSLPVRVIRPEPETDCQNIHCMSLSTRLLYAFLAWCRLCTEAVLESTANGHKAGLRCLTP